MKIEIELDDNLWRFFTHPDLANGRSLSTIVNQIAEEEKCKCLSLTKIFGGKEAVEKLLLEVSQIPLPIEVKNGT